MSYQALATLLKVLADPNRLEIVDLISCGELCACDLLAHFQFSQPTLSHHMKALVDCNLVITRKEGNKHMYQLNHETFDLVNEHLKMLNSAHQRCICHNLKSGKCS